MSANNNLQQMPSGMSGHMANAEQPAVNSLLSTGVSNPSSGNVPGMQAHSSSSAAIGGYAPGLTMGPGMANPAVVVGPSDAGNMASQNAGQNVPRFPNNPTNVHNDMWQNNGSNFGASNMPNVNAPFPDMTGMPQGPRFSGPDAGGSLQTGNANDNMPGRFKGFGMMDKAGMTSGPGNMSYNMNSSVGPQGTTGGFPPPHNADRMQGFGNVSGAAESDNFTGMERSGFETPGHTNNMSQNSGGGMRMPANDGGRSGFAAGRVFSGTVSRNRMQGQGIRINFGSSSRMQTPNDKTEGNKPQLSGDNTGPFQRPPFGNVPGMQGSDMQGGGSGSANFANMPGGPMSGMMQHPESGMVREQTPSYGKPSGVRPLMDDTFFNQSATTRPPVPNQQLPPLMSLPAKPTNANTALPPPPPPPPPKDMNNLASSAASQTFGPAPVGVPAPPPFQASVPVQQSAEQMQAAMAYYYSQWMQQQQQPQPPPPPPPPPQ